MLKICEKKKGVEQQQKFVIIGAQCVTIHHTCYKVMYNNHNTAQD